MSRYAETIIFGRPVRLRWTADKPENEALLDDPAKHVGRSLNFKVTRSDLARFGGPLSAESKAVAEMAYAALEPAEREALNLEIDRRYFAGLGVTPGTLIEKGQRGKAEIWNGFKRQVIADQRKLDALPPAIKSLLGGPESFTPPQLDVMVRLADKLAPLSAADLKDYESHVNFDTSDLAALEASIDRYLAARAERESAHKRREEIAQKLYGTENLYQELKQLGRTWAELHKQARDKDVQGAGHEAQQLRLRAKELREKEIADYTAKLKTFKFDSIQQFQQTLDAYEKAFLDESVAIAFGIMQKFEHKLWVAEQQYSKDAAVDALIAAARATAAPALVEQARQKIEQAQALSEKGGFQTVQGAAHEGNRLSDQAGKKMNEAQDLMKKASGEVRALPGQPLVADETFPRAELLTGDRASVKAAIFRYITDRRADIAKSRENLKEDPKIVYKLPKILGPSMDQQNVKPGTILHSVISDRQSKYLGDERLFTVVVALIGFALTLLTGGGGGIAVVAALGAFGVGAYQAVLEYREYEQKSAFAGVGLADDPSFAWVIVAVVGAGIDLAGAVSAVQGMRGAIKAFDESATWRS